MLREGDVVLSTEYAGAAETHLNIHDTKTASKRLNDAVTTFMALKTLPVQDTHCLHDVIVAIHAMCGALNVAMLAGIDESTIAECVAPAKELAGESPFVRRLQTWPRGYPGDFETVEYIIQQKVTAQPKTLGFLIELHSLTSAIVQQHRNKVTAQASVLNSILRRPSTATDTTKVLILAAGSSPDLHILLSSIQDAHFEVTLVDSDPDAIKFSMDRLSPIQHRLTGITSNVFKVKKAARERGPYDLVLAGGLFDYLPDNFATSLINTIFEDYLNPTGQFFFTNMIAPNPYRGWMQHIANWRIIERSEADLRRLVAAGAGENALCRIELDSTRLALMATVTRG
jgi:extracellular factor (EF) 3-hydroxypalmitic acid methyl ester biosynthesis protein